MLRTGSCRHGKTQLGPGSDSLQARSSQLLIKDHHHVVAASRISLQQDVIFRHAACIEPLISPKRNNDYLVEQSRTNDLS